MSFSKLTTLAAMFSSVAAHGYVSGIVSGGTYYGGFLPDSYGYQTPTPDSVGWSDTNLDHGFISPSAYTTGDIICAKDGKSAALSAKVAAGDTIDFQWTTWPESHHGPVITLLANCNGDCTAVDKTTLEFFKIDEGGLVDDSSVPGTWASDSLIANNNTWTTTIPADLAPGNYVARHEIIALHGAESNDGAQNYPQCINLEISGSGSLAPSGTLGEKLYTPTDPGILINIYASIASYTIPGPAMYNATGAATGSASATSAASVSTTAASVPASTSAPATSAAASSPVTSAASSVVFTSASPTTLITSVASASASASATPAPEGGEDDDDDTCEA